MATATRENTAFGVHSVKQNSIFYTEKKNQIFCFFYLHRGSYMSVHILLNELGKKIRCEAQPSILTVFPNAFNKFNNKGA